MRLFLIDKPGCHHITELIPGISSVYQLEQEFNPYLSVEFLPNREYPPGIILMVGNKMIRRNYTFDDPNDIIELRKLIWSELQSYHNIKDITDNEGCIKDFRQTRTNRVIQGWQAKKKEMNKNKCCKAIKKLFVEGFSDHFIKREEYRLSTEEKLDRNTCKQVRYKECGDNYPPDTPLFNRCTSEVNWLCNRGYPNNKAENKTLIFRERLKKDISEYLRKNNMKVNKQTLDLILSSGFFERVSNRVGNKALTYKNVEYAVNEITNDADYFLKLMEGYNSNNDSSKNDSSKNDSSKNDNSWNYNLIISLVIVFVLLLLYKKMKL